MGNRRGSELHVPLGVSDTLDDRARGLRTVFRERGGRITAGSSSPISDGAAGVLVASRDGADRYGLRPRGRILDQTTVGVDRGAKLGRPSGDDNHGAACMPRQPAWYRARHVMPEMRGCPDHERVRAEFGGHHGEFPGRVPAPGCVRVRQAPPDQPPGPVRRVAIAPPPRCHPGAPLPARSAARNAGRGWSRRQRAAGVAAASPCPPRRRGRCVRSWSRRTRR